MKILFSHSHSMHQGFVAQRGKIICPSPHRQQVAAFGFNSRNALPKKDLYGIAIPLVTQNKHYFNKRNDEDSEYLSRRHSSKSEGTASPGGGEYLVCKQKETKQNKKSPKNKTNNQKNPSSDHRTCYYVPWGLAKPIVSMSETQSFFLYIHYVLTY